MNAIAQLNDRLRQTGRGGQIMVTPGIASLHPLVQASIVKQVRAFNAFTADNDPYNEHDFGAIDVPEAGKIFWKIDYYDTSLTAGSDDPADPDKHTVY